MPSVTIISPDPANRAGGMERTCTLLAEVLENQGWSATIVGPTRSPTTWEFRLGLGHPVRSFSASRALKPHAADLVISNGYLGVASPRKIPRVHIFHGTMAGGTQAVAGGLPFREVIRRSLSAGAMEAIAGRSATRVVCVSESTAEEVRRYYRLRGAEVIPNGIDTVTFAPRGQIQSRERLGLDAGGRYAIFVGRFEYGKGGDMALQAARDAGYELLVAGPSAGAADRHLGVLAPDQLADAYAAADCVLFPTRYEGCSLAVLEAIACGRPLLTTRVGWMRTLLRSVPDYERLCVEPEVEDMVARLQALEDMDTEKIVGQARAFVLEHNSLERYATRWRELLQDVGLQGLPRRSGRLPSN